MRSLHRIVWFMLAATSCSLAASAATEPAPEKPAPEKPAPEKSPEPLANLVFVDAPLDEVREGYFTLEWSPVEGAAYYRLNDSADRECYRGVETKSFQSGLADGTFAYRVQAFDAEDHVLATSSETPVTVRHWGMFQSLVLFTIGLVVFGGIVLVILRGEMITRRNVADGEVVHRALRSSSDSGELQ